MGCGEAINCRLGEIHSVLLDILGAVRKYSQGTFKDTYNNWTRKRFNESWFYEQTVIFAGTTMTVQLDFPDASELNDIVLIFNAGAAARDFDIRAYTNPGDTLYAQIRTETTNTATNYRVCKIEEKFPALSRIELYFANYTVSDSVKITIQADDV